MCRCLCFMRQVLSSDVKTHYKHVTSLVSTITIHLYLTSENEKFGLDWTSRDEKLSVGLDIPIIKLLAVWDKLFNSHHTHNRWLTVSLNASVMTCLKMSLPKLLRITIVSMHKDWWITHKNSLAFVDKWRVSFFSDLIGFPAMVDLVIKFGQDWYQPHHNKIGITKKSIQFIAAPSKRYYDEYGF